MMTQDERLKVMLTVLPAVTAGILAQSPGGSQSLAERAEVIVDFAWMIAAELDSVMHDEGPTNEPTPYPGP